MLLKLIDLTPGYFSCYLGSRLTNIKIRDFRHVSHEVVKRALKGDSILDFADAFNQPALAKIQSHKGKVQIDMYEGTAGTHDPLLWLAIVSDGQELPLVQTNWEIFHAAGQSHTGFVALVKD